MEKPPARPANPRSHGNRIAERDTNQGAYSRRRFPTQISAKLAAEEDRAWG